jgi:hypothetical protein
MNRQALGGRGKMLGKEHPDTLTSMHDLAEVLQSQGRYMAAEEMYRQALNEREKMLGKEHPDTLKSVGKLAGVIKSQGRYAARGASADGNGGGGGSSSPSNDSPASVTEATGFDSQIARQQEKANTGTGKRKIAPETFPLDDPATKRSKLK